MAVIMSALHREGPGFEPQRYDTLGASRWQPVAAHLLLTQDFYQCRINEVHKKNLKKLKNAQLNFKWKAVNGDSIASTEALLCEREAVGLISVLGYSKYPCRTRTILR